MLDGRNLENPASALNGQRGESDLPYQAFRSRVHQAHCQLILAWRRLRREGQVITISQDLALLPKSGGIGAGPRPVPRLTPHLASLITHTDEDEVVSLHIGQGLPVQVQG